jgi:hypothetical protein
MKRAERGGNTQHDRHFFTSSQGDGVFAILLFVVRLNLAAETTFKG